MTRPFKSAGARGAGLARLGLGLALLCAVLLSAVVVAYRTGAFGVRDAFGYIEWIIYVAAAAVLVAAVGCVQAIRYKQPSAIAIAGVGIVIAILIVWVPYSNRVALRASPRLSDITTDPQNPPAFVKAAEIRTATKAKNPVTYRPAKAKLQAAHYPDIKPARLALPVDQAFDRALAAVNDFGWTVITADKSAGRIEASETSLIFGFVDDVAIRVTAEDAGSRVDIRSSSRVGGRDAAVNANRIRKLIRALMTP
jgi:uncharacterized protein (DUF1499 family)